MPSPVRNGYFIWLCERRLCAYVCVCVCIHMHAYILSCSEKSLLANTFEP